MKAREKTASSKEKEILQKVEKEREAKEKEDMKRLVEEKEAAAKKAKEAAAKAKEQQFLKQALEYIELLQPTSFAPFAGTYTLGSRRESLNDYRGVPSVSHATKFLNEAIIFLNFFSS